jgi:hypothetical protein
LHKASLLEDSDVKNTNGFGRREAALVLISTFRSLSITADRREDLPSLLWEKLGPKYFGLSLVSTPWGDHMTQN